MRKRLAGMLAAVACCLMVGVAPGAQAAEPDPVAIQEALARVAATGVMTDADRAIIQTDPELAQTVIDPGKTEVTDVSNETPGPAPVQGKTSCTHADRYIVYRSTLGFKTAEWHMRVDWCYNGKTVSSVTRDAYIAKYDKATIRYKGEIKNSLQYRPGNVNARTYMQGHLEQCVVKYGCYANYYPFQDFTVGNNGSYALIQRK
ncbi:hypothetical protein [Amycolatopsis pittospori]|uniref:hypothetical protein n=1 Tax=Amycolatopsis pittospori TaxID=2749434 RepID=UPI0015F084D5|nr:hypothetical protein [Amycolatopsis pittospori]